MLGCVQGLAEGDGSEDKPSSASQAQRQPPAKHSPSKTALLRESRSQRSSPEARGQQQQQHPRSWLQRFQEEMRCTLRGHERPGVVSRFPHSLQSMLNMRKELMVRRARACANDCQ